MVARSVVATAAVATSVVAAKVAARWVDPKSLIRWGSRHAFASAVIRAGLKTGDPYSRLCGDPAVRAHPYDFYDEIRARADVVPGRFALLSGRYEVVSELVRDPAFLAGFPDETMPRPVQATLAWARDPAVLSAMDRPSMLVSNGADHTRLRRLATKAFTSRAVGALAGRIDTIATDLLDAMERKHRDHDLADIITEYATTLPVLTIAEILGVPPSMQDAFDAWTTRMLPLIEIGIGYPTFRRAEAAMAEFNAWMLEHFAHLRREPGDSLLSRIIASSDEESENGAEGLSEIDLMLTATILLSGGFETTLNLIGNAVVALLAHPDQLAGLRAEPAGWANAVEEVLRFDPPTQNTYRYSATDTTVRGVSLRRGQFMILLLAAANRDPAVFTDPKTFDVTRANAREHLSFSLGPHFCVGAALARMEAEIALRRLFERFPDLAAAGEPTRRPSRAIRGFFTIPVRLGKPAGADRPDGGFVPPSGRSARTQRAAPGVVGYDSRTTPR